MGYGDFLIRTDSPEFNIHTSRPSTLSSAGALAMSEIWLYQPTSLYLHTTDLELHCSPAWKYHCSEAEGAGRDGCEQERVGLGVRDGSAG